MQHGSRLVLKFIDQVNIQYFVNLTRNSSFLFLAGTLEPEMYVSVDGLEPEDTCELVLVEKMFTALLEEVDVTEDDAD